MDAFHCEIIFSMEKIIFCIVFITFVVYTFLYERGIAEFPLTSVMIILIYREFNIDKFNKKLDLKIEELLKKIETRNESRQ
jgi:hypothetical protein